MTHTSVLLQAAEKARGFFARIRRSVAVVAGKVADSVESVSFYARNAFAPRTRRIAATVAMVAVPTVLFAGGFVQAEFLTDMAGTVALLLANILQIIVSFLGWLLVTVIGVLIWVAQYNGFITSPAVVNGWVLTRDIVNMFFVIFLLMMAFGIMLNVDKYASMDPGKEIVKLATAAILVNFSRTICGLLIDLSQVVMMTFVYGFKEAAGKNFLDAFRITALLQNLNADPSQAAEGGTLAFRVTVSMMLALIMTSIALGVVCVMTIMLAVRIVHLWLLVAISPIAFLPGKVVSKLDGIKSDWWGAFSEALVFGPLMAFFLWLSLVSVASGKLTSADQFQGTVSSGAEAEAVSGGFGLTEAFKDSEIQSFVIAIVLLSMGVKKAKSMAGAIGKTSEGIYGDLKKQGKGALSKVGGLKVREGSTLAAVGSVLPGGWTRDPEGRLRLISAESRYDQIKAQLKPKIGKIAQRYDERSQLTEARRLRTIGQGGAADKIEKDVLEKGVKTLSSKYDKDGLRKLMNDTGASQLTRQQAMKALADMGDDSLKGKGAAITGLVSAVGGSEDFEKSVREALKAKGDPDAMIKKTADIADMFEQMSNAQVSNQFEKILEGVQVGTDGNYKQGHALDKLLALDGDTFSDKNFKARKKVQQALLMAAETEKTRDPKKAAALQEKYKDLMRSFAVDKKMDDPDGFVDSSFDRDSTEAVKAVTEAKSKAEKDRAGSITGGKYAYSPLDVAASDMLNSSGETAKRLTALKDLQTKIGRGDVPDAEMIGEIEGAIQSFRDVADRDGKDRGLVDAQGEPLSNEEVLAGSAMFKGLESAEKRLREVPPPDASDDDKKAFFKKRAEDVSNMLKVATTGIEDADGGSERRRQAFANVAKSASGGFKTTSADLDRASASSDGDMRMKIVRKATKQGVAAVDAMLKRGSMSKELESELKTLKDELRSLSKASDPADQAAMMAVVKKKMDDLQKRLG